MGIVWLSLGMDPLHGIADAPRMPKARYDIMREYLPTRGELALDMMHLTATVQANFDYGDEADMVAKCRMAFGATPIVSAIFANSSLYEGKPSGFISRRLHIWQHTDPDRSGIPPFVFEAGFGYRAWVEWALDVPMFFVVRDGRYRPARGLPFRRFLREGFEGERATIGDFDRHLTTLFPDVRLKRILEVRGADAVPPGLICALPALWKGLFYDREALRRGRRAHGRLEPGGARGGHATRWRGAGSPPASPGARSSSSAASSSASRARGSGGSRPRPASPTSAASSIRSTPSSRSARARARSRSSAGKASGTAMWNA